MGKTIKQPRRVFFCGKKGLVHKYSGSSTKVEDWNDFPLVKDISDSMIQDCGIKFNSCLLNEYATGREYIGYHGDKEANPKNLASVAALSLGGSRDFTYKKFKLRKGDNLDNLKPITRVLNCGDLIVMIGNVQYYYKHTIPKRAHADYRISLTLRYLTN